MNGRRVDLLLATVLMVFPLLPTGPEYLGLPPGAWSEIGLILLGLVWGVALVVDRNTGPIRRVSHDLSLLSWSVVPFLVSTAGAGFVGLVSDNMILSPVFLLNLQDAPFRLLLPMDQGIDPLYSLRVGLTYFEGALGFLLVVLICRLSSFPRRRAVTALWGALIGLSLVSVFSVVQYLTRFNLHPYWVEANPDLVRSHATLEDPNTLGAYLVLGFGLTLGVALFQSFERSNRWRQWTAWTIGFLVVIALGTTVSRSAWGAIGLAIILTLAFWRSSVGDRGDVILSKLRRSARLVLVAGILLFSGWLAARAILPPQAGYQPDSPEEVVMATLDPRVPLEDLLKGRIEFWTSALQIGAENPLVGIGLGRFPRVSFSTNDELSSAENAHNFWLQLFAETGGVGFASFIFLVFGVGWTLRGVALSGSRGNYLAVGLTIAVLGFSLTLITGHALLLPSIQLLFSTSLATGVMVVVDSSSGASRSQYLGMRTLALGLSVLALVAYSLEASNRSWTSTDEQWGYHFGLHSPEQDPEGRWFRWTRGRSMLHLDSPAGVEALIVRFATSSAIRQGVQTSVKISVNGEQQPTVLGDGGWQGVRVPLSSKASDVLLVVEVDPVMVPALMGENKDRRTLGVMLRPPRFASGE